MAEDYELIDAGGGRKFERFGPYTVVRPCAQALWRARDEAALDKLEAEGRLALRYLPEDNPNGAMRDVAGVCDETGRVFGLMPHPERHIDKTQHPRWTRMQTEPEFATRVGDGLAIFKNAVEFFA